MQGKADDGWVRIQAGGDEMSNLHEFNWKDTSGVVIHDSNMYGRICSFGTHHLTVEPFRQGYWFWQFYRRHERVASGSEKTPEAAQATCEALWLEYLQSHPETDEMHLVGLNKNDIYESTIELYRWDESDKHSYNTNAELELGKAWNGRWDYQVSVMGPAGSGELGPLVGYFAKLPTRAEALKAGKERLKERCALHMQPELARKACEAVVEQINNKAQLELF